MNSVPPKRPAVGVPTPIHPADLSPEAGSHAAALASKATRGSVFAWLGNIGGFALRFAINVALARLLVPAEFGGYALATSYSELVGLLGAFGFPQALIQLEDGHDRLFDTVLAMTVYSSGALFLLSVGLAPIVNHYHGWTVAALFLTLSLARILSGASTCMESLLQREFKYGQLAVLRIIGSLMGSVAAVLLALFWSGSGAGALVLRDVGATLLIIVVVWWRIHRLRRAPIGRISWGTAREVWQLGKSLFVVRGLEILYHRIDQLVVGVALGTNALGLYAQARYLATLPPAALGPVSTAVGLRVFSVLREDPRRLSMAYSLLQYVVLRSSVPFGLAALIAPEFVLQLVFGGAWIGAAPILRILGIWMVGISVFENDKMVAIAMRRFGPIRVAYLVQVVILAVATVPASRLFGAAGVAATTTGALLAGFLVVSRDVRSIVSPERGTYIGGIVAAAAGVAVGLTVQFASMSHRSMVRGGAAIVAGAFGYTLALLLIERHRLISSARYLVQSFLRKAAPTAADIAP